METKKLEYIDVLRGLAIVLVVESHTARLIPSPSQFLALLSDLGTLGVQLFFVASALTLCLSMRGRGLSKRAIAAFYLRRYFRIAPLYYIGIALYGALSAFYLWAGTPERYNGDYSLSNVLANLFMVHGMYLPANNNIVPGGWSIGCEVLFYALFPYLFFRIKNQNDCRKFIVFAIVFNALIQFVFASALEPPVTVARYPFLHYFIVSQLPVFGFGMLLYFSLQASNTPTFPLARFSCFFLLTALGFHFDATFPFVAVWIPTVAALSFFYLGHFLAGESSSGWSSWLLAAIGRKSYSIYIFHFLFAWNLLGTTSLLLRLPGMQFPIVAWPVLIFSNLALSYALATLSGRWIEDVGIEWGRRLTRRLGLHR